MDKKSRPKVLTLLSEYLQEEKLPKSVIEDVRSFYTSYRDTAIEPSGVEETFLTFIDRVLLQFQSPYPFEHFHKSLRKPFDYYAFGLEFLRPLVKKDESTFLGEDRFKTIEDQINQNHNVVFFANHQIEADPIVISLMLEEKHPKLAHEMIFVAGERVITDPTAVPFSLGCNLLCIYSKRYIDHPPEGKHQKQLHNKATMQVMSELLKEGGKCIYVAPSGGRDRRSESGDIQIAPFDAKSIEMFYLMARKSKTPTHFYPMALSTYNLLPPPETVQIELGEMRSAKRVPIHLAIGEQIDMNHFPGSQNSDKHLRRNSRADYIWELVNKDYKRFPKES